MACEGDTSTPVAAFSKHPLTGKFSLWIWPAVLRSMAEAGFPPPGIRRKCSCVPLLGPSARGRAVPSHPVGARPREPGLHLPPRRHWQILAVPDIWFGGWRADWAVLCASLDLPGVHDPARGGEAGRVRGSPLGWPATLAGSRARWR